MSDLRLHIPDQFVDEVAAALAARLATDGLVPPARAREDWRLMTLAEAAAVFGRSERTVRKWVREGRLPRVHLDGGAWAFDPDDLRDFARTRRVGGPGPLAGPLAGSREPRG